MEPKPQADSDGNVADVDPRSSHAIAARGKFKEPQQIGANAVRASSVTSMVAPPTRATTHDVMIRGRWQLGIFPDYFDNLQE